MKRFVALIVSVVFLLSLTAHAKYLSDFATTNNIEVSDIFDVNNTLALESAFAVANSPNDPTRTQNPSTVSVEYSYMMESTVSNPLVTMNIDFIVGSTVYSTTVSGKVAHISLNDDTTFLAGPLHGTILLAEELFDITVGYNQIVGQEGINGCVTLVPKHNNSQQGLVTFWFGDGIVTNEILDLLLDNTDQLEFSSDEADASIMPPDVRAGTNGFTQTGSTAYGTINSVSGTVFTTKAYSKPASASYQNGKNLVYGATVTNCNRVESAFTNPYYSAVSDVLTVFTRVSSSSPSIQSIVDGDVTYPNPTDTLMNIITLGAGALAYYYPPADALDELATIIDNALVREYTPVFDPSMMRTHCCFNIVSNALVKFDNYPFLMGYELANNQAGLFAYRLATTVEFAVLDDGGLYYISSNTAVINNVSANCTVG